MSSEEKRTTSIGLQYPFPNPEVYFGRICVKERMGPCRIVIEAINAAEGR